MQENRAAQGEDYTCHFTEDQDKIRQEGSPEQHPTTGNKAAPKEYNEAQRGVKRSIKQIREATWTT